MHPWMVPEPVVHLLAAAVCSPVVQQVLVAEVHFAGCNLVLVGELVQQQSELVAEP